MYRESSRIKIYFDKNNCNRLVFEKDNKKHFVVIPPSKNCIDIFDPSGITKDMHVFGEKYYLHSVEAYVIITSETDRKVYLGGRCICKTKLTY